MQTQAPICRTMPAQSLIHFESKRNRARGAYFSNSAALLTGIGLRAGTSTFRSSYSLSFCFNMMIYKDTHTHTHLALVSLHKLVSCRLDPSHLSGETNQIY